MRFWQLVSVCRECPHVLESKLGEPGWESLLLSLKRFDELVENQERKELDQTLPASLVANVLQDHEQKIYVSAGHVRLHPLNSKDQETTCLEVYEKYGGDFLENLLESGVQKT